MLDTLTTHDSRLTTHDSRLTTHDRQDAERASANEVSHWTKDDLLVTAEAGTEVYGHLRKRPSR